jgi:hypothetical protein
MWNKAFFAGACLCFLMATSCKSKKNMVANPESGKELAVENLEAQAFLQVLASNTSAWETLHLRADGVAVMSGSSQKFKVDIRMRRDSLIWVDLAEPNLGLKVARAIIYPDSVAYYSNLLKKADAGSFEKLNQILGAGLNFKMFQEALIGHVALQPVQNLQVQMAPTSQLLFGQPSKDFKGFQGKEVTIALELDGQTRRLVRQELIAGADRIAARYEQFTEVNGQYFPSVVNLQTNGRQNVIINLQFTDIQRNSEIKTPFNYPQNYEPLRF